MKTSFDKRNIYHNIKRGFRSDRGEIYQWETGKGKDLEIIINNEKGKIKVDEW